VAYLVTYFADKTVFVTAVVLLMTNMF